MRRLLLALMIVMLPLRGWLGDAMAMDLVGPAVQTVASSAAPTAHAEHATPPCHDTAQAPMAGHDSTDHAGSSGHGHCTACQICHSVAATDVTAVPTAGALPHAAPQMAAPRFASAEPRLVAEPPIS